MASIVVCGGSIIGLATGLLLARDGHAVTILEHDPAPVPDTASAAWESWNRSGVPQFHQPHNLFPRSRHILEAELPEVLAAMLADGCTWVDMLASKPPAIADDVRTDDDRFRFVTGRRPVLEHAVATVTENVAGITVRRGVRVRGLLTGPDVAPGVPHVVGVDTDTGEFRADLVIDAMGRKSPLVDWLAALGGPPVELQSSDAGFIYYTRYFTGPEIPVQIGPPLNHFGSFSLLTITGDNATWSTTVWAANGDPALKELRNAKKFESVIRACPMQAHWHDGTPITEVLPMAGVLDRIRRFVVDERPVVTGILAVGDAWACTNPSAGRGMSVGIIHAQGLRDTLRTDGDPVEVALAFDEITQREVTPFFVSQYHADRMRNAEMVAIREGREAQRPSGPVVDLFAASGLDGDLFRGALETVACLALPEEVLARPVIQQALARHRGSTPMTFPAPNRAELLELLA